MKEIEKIIQNSGNNFHCRVSNFFNSKNWTTLISPYYTDIVTDKPREIDIIAENEYPLLNHFGRKAGTVNISLNIECKYLSKETVFWFDKKDTYKANEWILKNTPHQEIIRSRDKHRYLNTNEKVAKLFASSNKPSSENEMFYKALNQCLNAMVYNRRSDSIIQRNQSTKVLKTIEYPVIICNSFEKLYRVEIDDDSKISKIQDNFQIEVNYAYLDFNQKRRREYFLIDVIDFNKTDEFLDVLQKDAESIINIIRLNKDF